MIFDNISKLSELVKGKKIFLVAGKNSFIKSGAKQKINIQYTLFSDFQSNPDIKDVKRIQLR